MASERAKRRSGTGPIVPGRNVTIKDLAAELGLSITTISRALNGYADVGEKTRKRIAEAAQTLGYHPNRNAQRLVTQRTHNIAWVQPDNERKFLDPHFVEVMAGVLRGARAAHYDILMTSDTPERELATYDRYVRDNSVDGFILDLPRDDDPRVTYLLDIGRPFVVHGRETRAAQYGWVDIDNYDAFYRMARLMVENGHRRLAFINGDESYNYALYRRKAVEDAVADAGLPRGTLTVFNSLHPMGDAGFKLTARALEDAAVTGLIYSSILMAMEGHAAVIRAEVGRPQPIAIATMDDQLHYLDIRPLGDDVAFLRSSLRDAGIALVEEIARQCDGATPRGTLMPAEFVVPPHWQRASISAPLPAHRG